MEMPPSKARMINSGRAAKSITKTLNMLAKSLPSTSSLFVSRVSNSRSSVLRSFSCATAEAANMAEKNTAQANCRGARSWKRIVPKRARSPVSRTFCEPESTIHAVKTNSNRPAT